MKRFFKTIDDIHQFTMTLKLHQEKLQCMKCKKKDQLVSHGFVYKKKNKHEKRAVGKRIFCSNRYGKTGCGCTRRLYLTSQIPKLQFDTSHLAHFLNHLFAGCSIEKAYTVATKTAEPRNAYRWLQKLCDNLIAYRRIVQQPCKTILPSFQRINKRLQLLFSSLAHLLSIAISDPCAHFQSQQQIAFI